MTNYSLYSPIIAFNPDFKWFGVKRVEGCWLWKNINIKKKNHKNTVALLPTYQYIYYVIFFNDIAYCTRDKRAEGHEKIV